jgi:hypothetical protein
MKDTRMRSVFCRDGFFWFFLPDVKFSISGVNMTSRSSSTFEPIFFIDLGVSRVQLHSQDEGVVKAETP